MFPGLSQLDANVPGTWQVPGTFFVLLGERGRLRRTLVGAGGAALALVTPTLIAVAVAAAALAARAVRGAGAGRSVGIDAGFAQFFLHFVLCGDGSGLIMLAGLISGLISAALIGLARACVIFLSTGAALSGTAAAGAAGMAGS